MRRNNLSLLRNTRLPLFVPLPRSKPRCEISQWLLKLISKWLTVYNLKDKKSMHDASISRLINCNLSNLEKRFVCVRQRNNSKQCLPEFIQAITIMWMNRGVYYRPTYSRCFAKSKLDFDIIWEHKSTWDK